MSVGKVAAGCAGFFLLLPGLCFFGFGIAGLSSRGGGVITMTIATIILGVATLGAAVALIRLAFRPPEAEITHPKKPEPPKTD